MVGGAAPMVGGAAPVVGGAAPMVGGAAPVEHVEVAVGATFDLRLPANPTTGFQWKLQGALDAHLALVSETYEPDAPPAGSEPMVGRGGTAHFVFKGVSAGEATVVLGYLRAWDKGAAPMSRTVQVVVK